MNTPFLRESGKLLQQFSDVQLIPVPIFLKHLQSSVRGAHNTEPFAPGSVRSVLDCLRKFTPFIINIFEKDY